MRGVRIAEPDESPYDHNHGRGECQLPARKQGAHVPAVQGLKLALHSGRRVGLGDVALGLARLEILNGQRRRLAVAPRHLVHDAHGLIVATFPHVILGRLEDGEKEEARREHEQRKSAHRDHKVAPAHVVFARADGGCFLAGMVSEELDVLIDFA